MNQLIATLRDYVGAPQGLDSYLDDCLMVADALVTQDAPDSVPEAVRTRAVIEVAAELFHRRNAPNGIKSFGDLDGAAAIRVARDALVAARPLLDPWRNPLVFS